MTALSEPIVIAALLVALAVGFLLGRMGRNGRGDPSDVSRLRRQADARAAMSAPPTSAPPTSAPAPTSQTEPLSMPPEVHRHLQNGALINAIKALKDANPGMGLKDAKDAVEAYARRNGLG